MIISPMRTTPRPRRGSTSPTSSPTPRSCLLRNNQEVNRINFAAPDPSTGLVTIDDINSGQGAIADGTYVYRVLQIDVAGNQGSQPSTGLTVTIDSNAPLASAAPVLDPASDTSKGFLHTTRHNSPSPSNAPVFDVSGVETKATVILLRAPVVGGVVQAFVPVNTLTATAGGTVAIADINGAPGIVTDGSYVIPDGTYVYETQLIDLAGNVGPLSAISSPITIDTSSPAAPAAPVLDKASDTGISNTDEITRITLIGFPVIDVSGVEGNATVKLYRQAPVSSSSVLVGDGRRPRRVDHRHDHRCLRVDPRRHLRLHRAAGRPGRQRQR